MNQPYYGDNLHVLREHITDACVDLIYLGLNVVLTAVDNLKSGTPAQSDHAP